MQSSNLAAIDYEPKTKTLTVEFHSGINYDYDNVPMSVVQDLVSASSQGKYFNQKIDGKYVKRKK